MKTALTSAVDAATRSHHADFFHRNMTLPTVAVKMPRYAIDTMGTWT